MVALVAPAGAAARGAGPDADWTAYGHDAQLTNYVDAPTITRESAPDLRPAWTQQLDGAVVASPLAAQVDGRTVIFVSTESGSVYAIDEATAVVLWHRSFRPVVTDGCGSYGFSSTGAVDTTRGVVYEIGARGVLHAFDLVTGADRPGWPTRLISRTRYEYVWGGLRLVGSTLYVPVASYCDEPDPNGVAAEGRLVAVDVDTRATTAVFDPVPGYGNLGGMWGWGGVSVDPSGDALYTGVGNSWVESEACECIVDTAGYGDQMVKLPLDLSSVLDADRPTEVPDTGDEDFGAAPLLVRPHGCPPLAAANNKIGTLFVWDRDDLAAGPIDALPLSDGVTAFVGEPSWSPGDETLYDAGASFLGDGGRLGNGVIALRFQADCKLHAVWSAVVGDGPEPPPLVASDVVFAAGGDTGGFYAYAAATGVRLWSFPTPSAATLAPLIAVDGSVVAADTNGVLYVFRPRIRAGRPVPGTAVSRLGRWP